jgi:hypothetical protein
MLNKLFIIGCLILTGCATTQQPIKVVTQEVKIPIAMPCTAPMPVTPTFCFDKLLPTQDVYEKVQCMLSDLQLHLGYEIELNASLNSCVKN